MPSPRSVATPSIISPRRDETTCGTLDRSVPASVSVEQRADRQVHSDRDETRKLDRPFHRDQHAIRPILSSHPAVDLSAPAVQRSPGSGADASSMPKPASYHSKESPRSAPMRLTRPALAVSGSRPN